MTFEDIAVTRHRRVAGLVFGGNAMLVFNAIQVRRVVDFGLKAGVFHVPDPLLAALAGATFVNIQCGNRCGFSGMIFALRTGGEE